MVRSDAQRPIATGNTFEQIKSGFNQREDSSVVQRQKYGVRYVALVTVFAIAN